MGDPNICDCCGGRVYVPRLTGTSADGAWVLVDPNDFAGAQIGMSLVCDEDDCERPSPHSPHVCLRIVALVGTGAYEWDGADAAEVVVPTHSLGEWIIANADT